MKYLILVFLLISTSLWSNDGITLSKIRFVINGEKLNWKTGDKLPVNLEIDGTQPETLARFFKYEPGDILQEKDLLKELNKAGFRLSDSNLFYLSSISVVPPKKYPNKRTVVIKVNDGYRSIWGGGSIYGLAGKRNINGKGNSVIFTLGVNNISTTYIDESLGKTNLFSIYSLRYLNDVVEKNFEAASHYGELSYRLGYRFTPDFNIYNQLDYYTDGFYTDTSFGFNWKNKFNLYRENIYSWDLNSYYSLDLTNYSSFIESHLKNSYAIGPISLNLVFSGGRNIVQREDNSLSLIKGGVSLIRSDYKENQLEGDWYLYSGFQIDKSFKVINLPPIFNIRPIISLFADYSYLSTGHRDAYGAAASIFFESPIFTSLDFSYGLNRHGEGKFIFTVKSHF